jgi:citrate lyase beta subunit
MGLLEDLLDHLDDRLGATDAGFAARYPGEPATRQPVHTVYLPADRLGRRPVAEWGAAALALLEHHAATPADLDAVTGLGVQACGEVLPRVRAKLAAQPVEDLRIDFEDGYGLRPDEEEDAAATAAGQQLAGFGDAGDAPLLAGARIKGLQPATRRRGLRTLDRLLRAAVEAGGLPERFVTTLPKVATTAEVEAFVTVCERLEAGYGIPAGRLRFELQVEVPQAVLGPGGAAAVVALLAASAGRCEGLHYGTYDFSAALGVSAGQQALDHPLADHAKAVMQIAAAGTGVRVSDGSTNIVPAGDADQVRYALGVHARLVTRGLKRALYQGWDLHPGQLVTRYAATYAFLRGELAAGAARLRAYTTRSAAGVIDEPATAQALAGSVLRGLDCGACDAVEVQQATGLDAAALARLARRPG